MQSMPFNSLPAGDFSNQEPEFEDHLPDLDEPPILPTIATRPDYKSKDLVLYNAWNEDKSKENLSKLIEHLHPIIFAQVNRQGGSVAKAALVGTGRVWAAKAIKTYDPSKGSALSTHVANYIQRIKRLNYKYRGAARLPENKEREFGAYDRARANLEEELSRDPTPDEIGKVLGWSKGRVVKFQKLVFKDYVESGIEQPSQYEAFSYRPMLMDTILNRLTPDERTIFDNKGIIPAPQLAAKLGVDVNRLNYLQRKLVTKIADIKKEVEYDFN